MWQPFVHAVPAGNLCLHRSAVLEPVSRVISHVLQQHREERGIVKVFLSPLSRDTTEPATPCCGCSSIMKLRACFLRVSNFCRAAATRASSPISSLESSPLWAVSLMWGSFRTPWLVLSVHFFIVFSVSSENHRSVRSQAGQTLALGDCPLKKSGWFPFFPHR